MQGGCRGARDLVERLHRRAAPELGGQLLVLQEQLDVAFVEKECVLLSALDHLLQQAVAQLTHLNDAERFPQAVWGTFMGSH